MITQNGVLNVYVSERDLTGLSDGADSVLVEVAEAHREKFRLKTNLNHLPAIFGVVLCLTKAVWRLR